MRGIIHDLRFTVRRLIRRPLYPLVAVVILSLGLSTALTVFTYFRGFFQPYPGVDSARLIRVFEQRPEDPYLNIPYLDFQDYQSASDSFEGLAASQPYHAASVRRESHTEVGFLEAVSGNYFDVLDLGVLLGRGIREADDQPGAPSVAVLSYAWWQSSFGANPEVLGQTLYLNYRPFTIVGVMGPGYVGVASDYRPDVWIPIAPFKDRYVAWRNRAENREIPLVHVFGRLRPGVGAQQGLSELAALSRGLEESFPRSESARQLRVENVSWVDPRARMQEQTTVWLMLAAAAGLLILICANAANLLLAVTIRRQRELAVRNALGASPSGLVRQTLVEHLLLAGVAGAIALAAASPLCARLGSYFARPSVWGENVAREIGVDGEVVVFALVVSLLTGLLSAALPALRAYRLHLMTSLRTTGFAAVSMPRRLFSFRLPATSELLVTVQVSLAVVLLVLSSLVLRTLSSAGSIEPGFPYQHLAMTHISTSSTDIKAPGRDRFFREIAEALSREPWVESATVLEHPPLAPQVARQFLVGDAQESLEIAYSKVIPGFFKTLELALRSGRTFRDTDNADSPDVAVVNESFVRRHLQGREPLGRSVRWPSDARNPSRSFEIVGVVADARFEGFLVEPEPLVFLSYPQHRYPTGSALIVSTRVNPDAILPVFSKWTRDYEPHLAIVNVISYPQIVRGFLYTHRMNAELFSVLAVIGLVLSAVGIFSVGSLAVARRRGEIGVRMSLGATPPEISRLMVFRSLQPVILGIGLGLIATFAMSRMAESLLFGVESSDLVSRLLGIAVIVIAGWAAAYLPARRAAAQDPLLALRSE